MSLQSLEKHEAKTTSWSRSSNQVVPELPGTKRAATQWIHSPELLAFGMGNPRSYPVAALSFELVHGSAQCHDHPTCVSNKLYTQLLTRQKWFFRRAEQIPLTCQTFADKGSKSADLLGAFLFSLKGVGFRGIRLHFPGSPHPEP